MTGRKGNTMNDKRVRRINHSECDHPQTKTEMRKCRATKIAAVHGAARVAPLARPKAEAVAPVPEPDVSSIHGTITVLDAVVEALGNLGEVTYVGLQVRLTDGSLLDVEQADPDGWVLQVVE